MATLGDVNLNESTTITARLAAVSITRNSTVQFQEIMVLGDPDSTTSSAVAKVTNAANVPSTSWGLVVKQARPSLLTANSTAGTSTSTDIVAGQTGSVFVSAYAVVSTIAGPVACGFYSVGGGASSLVWPVTIWASGGVIKDSQQIAPPGYLFTASAGSTLTFQVASTGPYRVAVTYSTGV